MPVLILKALRVFDEALKGGVGLPCPAVENYQPNAKVLNILQDPLGSLELDLPYGLYAGMCNLGTVDAFALQR